MVSILIVTGVVLGLLFGLGDCKTNKQTNNAFLISIFDLLAFPTDDQSCGASHETYQINGSSILGKYSQAAVAVDNVYCSQIGRDILQIKKGSTIDAALAAAICNGVMNAHSMGIGGGCTILFYSK